MTKRRDNNYWVKRLEKDAPEVYLDFRKGKYETVKAARTAAGMIKTRTRLHELKNAYKMATPAEKDEFRRFIGCTSRSTTVFAPTISATKATNSILAKDTKNAIKKIMKDRKMRMGAVMKELGFSPHDQSLSMAIAKETKVCDEVLRAVESWLKKNDNSNLL